MKPKFQVFVSSTFQDLQAERRIVMEQILNLGHIPVGMELFQAGNEEQWKHIKRRISECDYLVLILAERYGSTDISGLSFTQREYEYALQCGVPVAAFLLHQNARVTRTSENVEHDKRSEINAFRALCSDGKLVAYWSDGADLANRVSTALVQLMHDEPRDGLVPGGSWLVDQLRLDSVDDSLAVARQVLNAIRDDFAYAGYYRKEQTIQIGFRQIKNQAEIILSFESDIIPLVARARLFSPRVEPPKQATLEDCTYLVNGIPVTAFHSVTKPSKDKLIVKYAVAKDAAEIADHHFWSSPVLSYRVVSEINSDFRLEVFRVTGHGDGDSIEPRVLEEGSHVEFVGDGAAFTAQGIKWKITRDCEPRNS